MRTMIVAIAAALSLFEQGLAAENGEARRVESTWQQGTVGAKAEQTDAKQTALEQMASQSKEVRFSEVRAGINPETGEVQVQHAPGPMIEVVTPRATKSSRRASK